MYQAEVTSWYGVNLLLVEISVNVLLQNMLITKVCSHSVDILGRLMRYC